MKDIALISSERFLVFNICNLKDIQLLQSFLLNKLYNIRPKVHFLAISSELRAKLLSFNHVLSSCTCDSVSVNNLTQCSAQFDKEISQVSMRYVTTYPFKFRANLFRDKCYLRVLVWLLG